MMTKNCVNRLLAGLALLAVALSTVSCEKNEFPLPPRASMTMMVYLAANNSLGGFYDQISLDKLQSGATRANIGANRIMVYYQPRNSVPKMLEIKAGKDGKGRLDTVKWYPAQNSASAAVMRRFIDDAVAQAPAGKYCLDIWSHGSGWVPATTTGLLKAQKRVYDPDAPMTRGDGMTRSVIEDITYGTYMDITALAQAIPDGLFEFILFDACYMGSVEVAYDLRNETEYIIASPAEILAEGMPYDLILPELFSNRGPSFDGICKKFYDFYAAKTGSGMNSATIAMYDCSKLDALAQSVKTIVSARMPQVASTDLGSLQRYGTYDYERYFYDLGHFIHNLLGSSDPVALARFNSCMADVVKYKYATEWLFKGYPNKEIEVKTYSGLSTYVPVDAYVPMKNSYMKTAWAKFIYQ